MASQMVAAWIGEEFADLSFGDARLDRRAEFIVDNLSRIAESQPAAAKSTAALKAQYRFIANRSVSQEAILDAHNQAAIRRTTEYPCVILVQDTTTVDVTKPNRQVAGAGPLESEDKQGFFLHPLYALSFDGIPLGIVDQVNWTRDSIQTNLTPAQKARARKLEAFEEKESHRWLEMFQSAEQIARAHPETEYIVVGDSEADICELYAEVTDLADNCHFVVRGSQNRAVRNAGEARNLDEILASAKVEFLDQVEVSERVSKIAGETRSRRKSRSPRLAQISIRKAPVTLRGPERPGGKLPDVTLNVVEAVELDPPEGETAIRWVLLTTLSVDSIADIRRVLTIYTRRWQIELFFKTLKSGLHIEDLRYETLERYLTAVALLTIVAWRVEYLKGIAREDSEASCEKFFPPEEWQPTYLVYSEGQAPPAEPPSTREFLLIVAELGGWQRSKHRGDPGSITLWRGIRKMTAYAEAFRVFQKLQK